MTNKTRHPLYSIWQGIKRRCLTPTAPKYKDYGGRGIQVCERWLNDFWAFANDMGDRPPGMTIERKNVDGHYEPDNCIWANRQTQQRNQRRTIFVEIDGVRYKAIELADIAEKKVDTIVHRVKLGWPYEKVISKKKFPKMDAWKSAVKVRISNQLSATECKRGHPWNDENTGWQKSLSGNKARYCKACDALRGRGAV